MSGRCSAACCLSALGWRWVFWATVPFAVLGALAGWLVVPKTTGLNADRRFDIPGALLLMPVLTALLLIISESFAWGFDVAGDDRLWR